MFDQVSGIELPNQIGGNEIGISGGGPVQNGPDQFRTIICENIIRPGL